MIGLDQLRVLVAQSALTEPGASVEEWCRARDIDPAAVSELGANQASAGMVALSRKEARVDDVFSGIAVLCFQVGVDLERSRRDREELPSCP